MEVFVTGANGLLASHVIRRLLDSGQRVTGLIRDPRRFQFPGEEGVNLIPADLRDSDRYRQALKDCDAVVHIAAYTSPSGRDYGDYHRVNVEGTRLLLEACVEAGVRRFVQVSTANSFGYGSREEPGHEELPMKSPFTQSFYALSKKEADLLVRSYADRMQVSLVHPTFMIGAYDARPSSGAIVLMGSRRVVWVPPGGKNFVNASDAAAAVIAALERGAPGRSYLVAGENLTYGEFFRRLNAGQRRQPLYVPLPSWMLRGLGRLGDWARLVGVSTALSSANLGSLCITNFYGSERMRSELGVEPGPIDTGITEAVSWFRKEGML